MAAGGGSEEHSKIITFERHRIFASAQSFGRAMVPPVVVGVAESFLLSSRIIGAHLGATAEGGRTAM